MKIKRAFTLIELLVVIAIIGVLATISIIALQNARAKSRDAKRAGDMKQIQTALELFFNDKNRYPTMEEFALGSIFSTSTYGTSTYMQIIPSAPTPVDGSCTSDQNSFYYTQTENGNSYTISFCLGNTTGTLDSGPKCLTPGGILDLDCSASSVPCDPTCDYGYACQSGSCVLKDNFFFAQIYGNTDSTNKEIYDLTSDSQYIYAVGDNGSEGAGQTDGMIIKYDKTDLTIAAKRIYGGTGKDYFHAIVEQGNYIYAAGIINRNISSQDGVLAKFNKSDLSLVSALSLGNGSLNYIYSIAKDDSYLYVGIDNTVMVYDFDLNLIKQNSYASNIRSLASDGNYLYLSAVLGNSPLVALKINKTTMAVEAENAYGRSGITFFQGFRGAIDSDYYYAYGQIIGEGPGGRSAVILKFDKSDLSLLGRKIYGGSALDYFGSLCLSGGSIYGVGYTGSSNDGSGDIWVTSINRNDLSLMGSEVIRERNLDTWGYEEGYVCWADGPDLYIGSYLDEYDDLGGTIFGSSAGFMKIKPNFVSSDTGSASSIFTVSPYAPTVVDSNLDITDPNISSQAGALSGTGLSLTSSATNLNVYGPYIIE